MSFEQSQVIHNTSILSRRDDSLIPCSDTLTMPIVVCSGTQLNTVAMVTSSVPSSAVASPQKAKHSDISSVCSHTSTSLCDYDDDMSSRDTPLCDLDSILNVLRTEIRSVLTDTGIGEKPDWSMYTSLGLRTDAVYYAFHVLCVWFINMNCSCETLYADLVINFGLSSQLITHLFVYYMYHLFIFFGSHG